MKKQTLLLPLLILFAHLVTAQTVQNLKPDHQLSILNGRAFFDFPKEAKIVPRQGDIMSADPNADKETRIIMDAGDQRMVFFARELFVTSSGSDFFNTVNQNNKNDFTNKVLIDRDSLIAVLSTPLNYDSTSGAIMIHNLNVRTGDGTIFAITTYLNPAAYKNHGAYQKLSEKIFLSLSKGNRRMAMQERTEKYRILGGAKSFLIEVPYGYVITKDAKYDFEVLKFQKINDIRDTNRQSLTLYTGNHPSWFHTEFDFVEKDAVKQSGTFLGQPAEWLYFKKEDKSLFLKEQKFEALAIEKNLLFHIAMMGNNEKGISEMTSIVQKIKIEPDK